MNITEIKKLADKEPVQSVSGIIEKQYPPSTQTDKDKEFGQHRQAILIHDDSGEKLMLNLMKESLHVLDDVEGARIELNAGSGESGPRGLVFNTWRPSNSEYDKQVLKVYPDASIKITSAHSARGEVSTPSDDRPSAQIPAPPSGGSDFERHVELCGRGYSICLAEADKIIKGFMGGKILQDPESLRNIATTLWINSQSKIATLSSTAGIVKAEGGKIERGQPSKEKKADTPFRLAKAFKIHSKSPLEGEAKNVARALVAEADRSPEGRDWTGAYILTVGLWADELMGLMDMNQAQFDEVVGEALEVYRIAAEDEGKDIIAAKRKIILNQGDWVKTISNIAS